MLQNMRKIVSIKQIHKYKYMNTHKQKEADHYVRRRLCMLQNMGDKWTLLLVLITFSACAKSKYQMRFRHIFESLSFGKTAEIQKLLKPGCWSQQAINYRLLWNLTFLLKNGKKYKFAKKMIYSLRIYWSFFYWWILNLCIACMN